MMLKAKVVTGRESKMAILVGAINDGGNRRNFFEGIVRQGKRDGRSIIQPMLSGTEFGLLVPAPPYKMIEPSLFTRIHGPLWLLA